MKRVYECRVKYTKCITMVHTVESIFDESEKIKDVELNIKNYVARHCSTQTKRFTVDDVKIRRIA